MARQPRLTFPGSIHHVYARGNARNKIFFVPEDYERFLDILADLKKKRPFRLYAYCLMSNHLHLLIEALECPLSKLMNLLLGEYARYLNARLKRTGHVFQGRFKSPLCVKDEHFKHLVRYIHLNPVRAGLVVNPASWPYSGHIEYLGRGGRGLVDQELLLSMFHDDEHAAREAYARFVLDEISGSAGPGARNRDSTAAMPIPKPVVLPSRPIELEDSETSLEELALMGAPEVTLAQLRGASKVRSITAARHAFMRRAFSAGYTPTDIAGYLGLTVSAISKALSGCLRRESQQS